MASTVFKIKPKSGAKSRFFVSISKSVAKKAVVRNKTKRRIRSVLRPLLKKYDKDVFVIVRPEATQKNFQELKEEIQNHIAKLK